jgi:hypothetical protein
MAPSGALSDPGRRPARAARGSRSCRAVLRGPWRGIEAPAHRAGTTRAKEPAPTGRRERGGYGPRKPGRGYRPKTAACPSEERTRRSRAIAAAEALRVRRTAGRCPKDPFPLDAPTILRPVDSVAASAAGCPRRSSSPTTMRPGPSSSWPSESCSYRCSGVIWRGPSSTWEARRCRTCGRSPSSSDAVEASSRGRAAAAQRGSAPLLAPRGARGYSPPRRAEPG